MSVLFGSFQLKGQDYYYKFEGSGASGSVSTVRVKNLSSGEVLTIFGSEVLHLTGDIPDNVEIANSIKVYPNPVSRDYAVLQIHAPLAGNAVIRVYTLTGKLVASIPAFLGNYGQSYRLSGLSRGFNVIRVDGNGYHMSVKLMWNTESSGTVKLVKISDENPLDDNLPGQGSNAALDTVAMHYNDGDRLLFRGTSDNFKTLIVDIPAADRTVTFPFYPCSDGDNNSYTVVEIGSQVWMAENLMSTKYNDGTAINFPGTDDNFWNSDSSGAYSWYGNDEAANKNIYGALYNWHAVSRGILCPAGWHVPSDREWMALGDFLGGDDEAGGKIKETGTGSWTGPNAGSTNESGFSALPGGSRSSRGFSQMKMDGFWWSSSFRKNVLKPSGWNLSYSSGTLTRSNDGPANDGYSLRCLLGTSVVSLPFVLTGQVSEISTTSVSAGGMVTSDEGGPVTTAGVCWNTSENPTVEDDKTSNDLKDGAFDTNITGLKPGTTYYIRAYATNSAGTAYGDNISFSTDVALPTVTTSQLSGIGPAGASSGGNVTDNGGGIITSRGVCWSRPANPTINDPKTADGTGTGNFTSTITGLQPGVSYHVRAWATNSAGTSYGADLVFTTSTALSAVTTTPITGITASSASSGGTITNDGGGIITARGVCWSTSASPTVNDAKTTNGSGTGTFSSAISGLRPGTTYHARAYATNSAGTSYGEDITFTTLVALPELSTMAVSGIRQTTASAGGNVTGNGGGSITERGVCWSLSASPTIAGSRSSDGTGTGSFASSVTGLLPETTYHLRAYATNSAGTAYGNELTFTTLSELPVLTTSSVINITTTSASSGGNISDDGGRTITGRGVCWSQSANPTISGNRSSDGTGTGTFTSSITGLQPGTTYHARAYATNGAGTAYGADISFTTNTALPEISTSPITAITSSSASSGGNITSTGGGNITERGVCWSTAASPTVSNPRTTDGSGSGSFTSSVSGLQPGTTYHLRSYATNSAGTAYGEDVSFTTLIAPPEVTTSSASGITQTAATAGGNVTDAGGGTVSARGVCWSTVANPSVTGNRTSDGSGTGSFTSQITGLQAGTTYHIRAYATNSAGTSYGSDLTFATTAYLPTLSTAAATNVTGTTATSGGAISSDGGGTVTARGVCWSASPSPTISDTRTSNGTGTGTFTSSISGLKPGTVYHVRSYATNSAGTAYGEDLTFTTLVIIPVLTTTTVTGIKQTYATSGGNITDDGGGQITERGVCWATASGPTISGSRTSDGSGSGTFASSITGLQPTTPYYARAYATNSAGTAYGNEVTFSTLSEFPSLTTLPVTNITHTGAASGGNITDDGGHAITERGVCWASSANPSTSDNRTSDGSGSGSYSSAIAGLTPGAAYHVRAYATNSAGTSYGQDISFSAIADPATVTTSTVSGITGISAVSGGNITSDGGGSITVRGVCWAETAQPTTAGSRTTDGTGAGVFTSTLTGLKAGTTYHIRAYAVNNSGTSYGEDIQFTTLIIPPTLTTTSVTSILQTTASSGGNITDSGGAPVTERGICWGTTSGPTVSGNKTSDGSGSGSFTSSITGLITATTYFVRAYAVNSAGTSYGNEISFNTLPPGPPVINFIQPTGDKLLHSRGSKRVIYTSDHYIKFSNDYGATYNAGVNVTGIFTLYHKARILENGTIVLFCVNKMYYSTDNMTTINPCTVLDKNGSPYTYHTPVSDSYPGSYFHFMNGFEEKAGVCLLGNYGNSATGACPINLYYSLDGITWKVIYTFGQDPNCTDNGTPSGGTGGTLLGDPTNPLIARHVHAINIGDDGSFYACTGDVGPEMHFLKCTYDRGSDTWTINDVLAGASRNWQRMRALGVYVRNGYYYWGSDGPGTFDYNGVTYDCWGIYKCPIADINDPSKHVLLQPLNDSCYSFYNDGQLVFSGMQSYNYLYISLDYGETWYPFQKPSWMTGEVAGVWHNSGDKTIVTEQGVIITSDSF